MIRAAGLCVGAFTSPHLLRYNERIRVDRRGGERRGAHPRLRSDRDRARDTTLTFFEYNALAGLYVFRDQRVDVAVPAMSLGRGQLDTVNILDAPIAEHVEAGERVVFERQRRRRRARPRSLDADSSSIIASAGSRRASAAERGGHPRRTRGARSSAQLYSTVNPCR